MKYLIIGLGTLGVMLLFAILFAFPIKWLWNWLMPTIFGLMEINVWQALGINLLSGFIFKSYTSKES